ncbi:putative permease protein, ABC-type sugar transporter [Aurantimonas manganoxydans SI85-9A1]|uniref:Putative permease protein, ABC-type sugar transporter n=1 Tax=Aurantimonas manganoxydans (strain ATCC BAA-1229 / DSM 21871 / SI85-9A1) TaxID=287752 RepID=Q1YGR5_AURMS|nr:ABC transporter permease [Aurantimonas manganoxydans]EAS49160.1 putative permease protein, ABC-type sugar transporter [Aurantimonas manganoxydans SI85-9A1]
MRLVSNALASPQGVVLIAAILFALVIGGFNPDFLSLATLVDLMRNSLVTGIFALGVMMVLASGGIDVSFTAIGAFAMYTTMTLVLGIDIPMPVLGLFVISALIGASLGLVNGLLIGGLGLPTLIVTLGTLSLFRGALLTFVGTTYITTVPRNVISFARTMIVRMENAVGQLVSLPLSFVVLILAALAVGVLMNLTRFGRTIYAIGGSEEGARRIGINVSRVKIWIYVIAGTIAGLAGMTHMTLSRMANPFDLVGIELNVIAAVVLGGARISGGHGTVVGTLLGALVITMINTSLISAGVPSYWQKVVVGILIILGTGLPIVIDRFAKHRERLARAAV